MKSYVVRAGLLTVLFLLASPWWGAWMGLDAYTIAPEQSYAGPNAKHWLGTDELGRDSLSRIILGGQVSIMVALASTMLSGVIGTFVGMTAGYFGGWFDNLSMRLTDMMAALPRLPVMLVLLVVDEKYFGDENAAMIRLILVMGLFGWMNIARLARSTTLEIKNASYVMAARSVGARPGAILARHILPNALVPVSVAMSIALSQAIIYENVISFLGLGISPPTPSWGGILNQGLTYLHQAPLLVLIPGGLTFLFVVFAHFFARELRVALDPRVPAR